MAEIVWAGRACLCCTLVIANGDESGCRDYYGHTHETATLPTDVIRRLDEEQGAGPCWSAHLFVVSLEPEIGFCDLGNHTDDPYGGDVYVIGVMV